MGSRCKFIDDDPNQAIQIKGFDLDFDTLTWTLLGMRNTGEGWGSEHKKMVTQAIRVGDFNAPLTLSSTGLLTPKTTISYEDGNTWYQS